MKTTTTVYTCDFCKVSQTIVRVDQVDRYPEEWRYLSVEVSMRGTEKLDELKQKKRMIASGLACDACLLEADMVFDELKFDPSEHGN